MTAPAVITSQQALLADCKVDNPAGGRDSGITSLVKIWAVLDPV